MYAAIIRILSHIMIYYCDVKSTPLSGSQATVMTTVLILCSYSVTGLSFTFMLIPHVLCLSFEGTVHCGCRVGELEMSCLLLQWFCFLLLQEEDTEFPEEHLKEMERYAAKIRVVKIVFHVNYNTRMCDAVSIGLGENKSLQEVTLLSVPKEKTQFVQSKLSSVKTVHVY